MFRSHTCWDIVFSEWLLAPRKWNIIKTQDIQLNISNVFHAPIQSKRWSVNSMKHTGKLNSICTGRLFFRLNCYFRFCSTMNLCLHEINSGKEITIMILYLYVIMSIVWWDYTLQKLAGSDINLPQSWWCWHLFHEILHDEVTDDAVA